jgi:hypothetical protein
MSATTTDTIGVLASGYAKMGVVATGLVAIGRIEATVDNSAGAAGDKFLKVMEGAYWWANATSTDTIAQADVGALCYVLDNQTVAKTDGSAARSVAGRIAGVDATKGVLVEMGMKQSVT